MEKQKLPLESGCWVHHEHCEVLFPKKKVSFDYLFWEDQELAFNIAEISAFFFWYPPTPLPKLVCISLYQIPQKLQVMMEMKREHILEGWCQITENLGKLRRQDHVSEAAARTEEGDRSSTAKDEWGIDHHSNQGRLHCLGPIPAVTERKFFG